MTVDPSTPVVVGLGDVSEPGDDPLAMTDAIGLMAAAVHRAVADAGAPALLAHVDRISIPEGLSPYPDPGRLVARRIGVEATTTLAHVGVLQTSILAAAARRIAAGRSEVEVVCGGEAHHRTTLAARAGVVLDDERGDGEPDESLRPAADIHHPVELARGLVLPAPQYAVIESALAAGRGFDAVAHRAALDALLATAADAASSNPVAWRTEPHGRDRVVSDPYTRADVSDWTVNQAAAVIVTSAAAADRLGVARDRWLFPVVDVTSDHMVPLVGRAHLDRAPAFAVAGAAALDHTAGLAAADVDLLELYSCFPAAVQVQQTALDIDPGRAWTRTGGMALAGGPLNNFVLQAAVVLGRDLRDTGGTAMFTAVSGMITKSGLSLWSAGPPSPAYRWIDVTDETAAATATLPVDPDVRGPVQVVGATVVPGRDAPSALLAVVEAGGVRSVAGTDDPDLVGDRGAVDWVGERLAVVDDGSGPRLRPFS